MSIMKNYQQNPIPYQLILDEMERTLSPAEAEELEQWKAASPENQAIYNGLKDAEDQLALLDLYRRADVDRGWSRISSLIQEENEVPPVRKRGRTLIYRVLAAAAILIGVSVVVFNWFFPAEVITYRTAKNERRHIVLPDNSDVFLNENSALSYEKTRFHKDRHMKLLEGEAYVIVAHNEASPFRVQLGEVIVQDIGTSFDLKMDAGKIEVIVSSGLVSMEYPHPLGSKKIVLAADHLGVFDRQTKQISQSTVIPINYKAWQDQKLRYVQTPLADVFKDMNRIYGTQVIFQDTTLKERKLSAFFDQKTEDQILDIIAASLQLKVVKKDGTFILSQ